MIEPAWMTPAHRAKRLDSFNKWLAWYRGQGGTRPIAEVREEYFEAWNRTDDDRQYQVAGVPDADA
jgi:hypothetical protein